MLLYSNPGERAVYYQPLYRQYSRLNLTVNYDRPIAIDDLQQRLLRTMDVQGGFGIFYDGHGPSLLLRSLLWRRGHDTQRLERIRFPVDSARSTVPSWSWMAHAGGIDYFKLGFGHYEWEDLQSPWSAGRNDSVISTNIALTATAHEYDTSGLAEHESEMILDDPAGFEAQPVLCAVLAKAKSKELQKHFVLIVVPTAAQAHTPYPVYERVGAGYLPGKCISPTGMKISIH